MDIRDFSYKENKLWYIYKHMVFEIDVHDYFDEWYLRISTREKGYQARKMGEKIKKFLQSHFYEHPRFRLQIVTGEKKKIKIHTLIEKAHYQFFYAEYLLTALLLLSFTVSVTMSKSIVFTSWFITGIVSIIFIYRNAFLSSSYQDMELGRKRMMMEIRLSYPGVVFVISMLWAVFLNYGN